MAFRCGDCGRAAKDREKPVIRPAGTRDKTYPRRERAQRVPNQSRRQWRTDPGGIGSEMRGQVLTCRECVLFLED